MNTIAERLKFVRKILGLSQAEFAERFGANTNSTVSDWENERSFPNHNQFYHIAHAINKTADWLINGDELSSKDEKIKKLKEEKQLVLDQLNKMKEILNGLQQIKETEPFYNKVAEKKVKYKKSKEAE